MSLFMFQANGGGAADISPPTPLLSQKRSCYTCAMEPTQATDSQLQPPVEAETLPAQSSEDQEVEPISWEASEYIHHEKDMMWFVGLVLIGVVLSLLSIFLLQSITFTVLIIVMVVALIVLSRRPPRVLKYQLSDGGLTINDRHYTFHEFRAFGVVQDGPFYYISLIPNKRFMPPIDVYFPEENGEEIIDIFGYEIPMQTIKPDFIDKLTRQLRL